MAPARKRHRVQLIIWQSRRFDLFFELLLLTLRKIYNVVYFLKLAAKRRHSRFPGFEVSRHRNDVATSRDSGSNNFIPLARVLRQRCPYPARQAIPMRREGGILLAP